MQAASFAAMQADDKRDCMHTASYHRGWNISVCVIDLGEHILTEFSKVSTSQWHRKDFLIGGGHSLK